MKAKMASASKSLISRDSMLSSLNYLLSYLYMLTTEIEKNNNVSQYPCKLFKFFTCV